MRNRVRVGQVYLPAVVRAVGRQGGGHEVVGGVLVGDPATTDEPVGGTAVVGECIGSAGVDHDGALVPPASVQAGADCLYVAVERDDVVVADRGLPAVAGKERGARLRLTEVAEEAALHLK